MDRSVVPVTSAAVAGTIAELAARPGATVIGVAVDVGQQVPLEALRDVALAAGAVRCHVFDRREGLADAFLWPALRAGAIGVAGEPILTALSAPCVAEVAVEVARLEEAGALVAAAAALRERQRLLAALRDLAPGLGVIAAGGASAAEERNLWAHVQALAPTHARPAEAAAPGPGGPAALVIRIERGVPVAVNGVAMTPLDIIDSLATIGRVHGIAPDVADGGAEAPGQRWLVEAPAAAVLHRACATLAEATLDAPALAFAAEAAEAYARLARDGRWFTRLRGGLDAFAAHVFGEVSGEVAMTMRQGRIEVAA
jgi:argininosuccinate synthase